MTQIMDRHSLQSMRRALGMTQSELAEKLDVKQAIISRWENGREEIPRARALELRDFLFNTGDALAPIIQRLCRWNMDLTVLNANRTILRLGRMTSKTFRIEPSEARRTNYFRWMSRDPEIPEIPSMLNPDFDILGETCHTDLEGDTIARSINGRVVKARIHVVTYSVRMRNDPDVLLAYPACVGPADARPSKVKGILSRDRFE